MEILQTIWTALTTENEALMPFISIPFVFIEITVTLFLSITLLNLKKEKNKILIYIAITSILSIINTFLSDAISVIINFIIVPLTAVFILKQNFFKGLLIEFLPIIFILISETIWVNFANITFNISADDINTIPLYRITMACLNYLAIFIITIIFRRYKFNITLFDGIDIKSKTVLTFNSIIGIISIASQLYLLAFYSSKLPYSIIIIGLLSLLTYFFISIYN